MGLKCRHLPSGTIFAVGLSSINDIVFVIAGTLFSLHALPVVIHVGSLCTATTIHWTEADLAGVVRLTEGAAGTATGGHVVAIDSICWTSSKPAWKTTRWGC